MSVSLAREREGSHYFCMLWDMLAAGRGLRLAHVLMLPMILLVVGLLKLSLDVFVSDFLFIYLIIRVFNVAV